MKFLALLAILLQNSPDEADSQEALRTGAGPLTTQVVPLSELKNRISSGEYVPVPRSFLNELERDSGTAELPDGIANRSQIRHAHYTATLEGTRLSSGTVEFQFYDASDPVWANLDTDANRELKPELPMEPSGPLLLGSTSLQQLKLSDDQGPVALGSDASRRLFVLRPGVPRKLFGSWEAEGLVAGDLVTFRMELPVATASQIELRTPLTVQVSSVGSLVLGPKIEDSIAVWTLIPGDSSRLIFNCRPEPDLSHQAALSLNGFSASHSITGDVLNSRWTIGLPASTKHRMSFTARIPDSIRISEVSLEDKWPVEWSVSQEKGQRLLKMVVPEFSSAAVLTVAAESVLPPTETWNLPMLSPITWQSEDSQHRGLILLPVSQLSVVLPGTIKLEEWMLVGIQERDVVTRPDQSREYQLTQFLPEASAVVRTSTSQPRISNAVITLVEPAGRLATVRCLVNVTCAASPVMELKWPVTAGWQVIAARYASNSRALFIQTVPGADEPGTEMLVVQLPEALEPNTSRLLEIQFQQTDSSELYSFALPLQPMPEAERTESLVMFPPAFTWNSDLQRRWSTGRRAISLEDFKKQAPWFPETRLITGAQVFESRNSTPLVAPVLSAEDPNQSSIINLEHNIRIADGLIVENSRILIPAGAGITDLLTVTVAAGAGVDLRWTVDGESVAAKRVEDPDLAVELRRWEIPLGSGSAERTPQQNPTGTLESPVVVHCESRRPVSPEFVATLPVPDSVLPIQATLQLFSTDEGLLSVTGLAPKAEGNSKDTELKSTSWKLEPGKSVVQVRIDENPLLQSGQTIDLHVLHLVGESNGMLLRDMLAVANVSRTAGQNSLPLALSANLHPLVLVNGHRVQLKETSNGFSIPLPPSTADCQVLVRWTEAAERSRSVTGERALPRLFLNELAVPQCTHHFLVHPELEVASTNNPFAASEPTEIAGVLNRLLISSPGGSRVMQAKAASSVPPEVRQFVIRWQMAAVQGWQPQTLIDTVETNAAVQIQVTQLRRRKAIMVGVFLLLLLGCIAIRNFTLRNRVGMAFVALSFLAISFLVDTPVVVATLLGAFWGLSLGLAFVMLMSWRWLWFAVRTQWASSLLMAAIVWPTFLGTPAAAQSIATPSDIPQRSDMPPAAAISDNSASVKSMAPDVIVPETAVPEADVIYVRRDLVEERRQKQSGESLRNPEAVVTSLHSRVVVDAVDSIELQLSIGVSAVTSHEEATLRIPLQDSRLVECLIDGVSVLPDPDGTDAIRVRIPASRVLPDRMIDNSRAADTVREEGNPVAVDAGALAAFTVHRIECRLRPITLRQTSGVQFRLPGLPCPAATLEVLCAPELFSIARIQSQDGSVEWEPSQGLVSLRSLAMSQEIMVRLLQSEIEKGSPRQAAVQMLTISETTSGQQTMNCICRFSQWNKLTSEVRYRVPQGCRLVSVSATTGADVITDLLWSVDEQNATIQLPSGVGENFILSLQIVSLTPSVDLNQSVPIAQLQQFADCVVSPGLYLAVRVNPVFSVLPPTGERITTAAFADLQSEWGQWLRRSDVVFRVPSSNSECVIRLTPRTTVNEVFISQNAVIREGEIDWKSQIDIETTVLPVFRHRLTVHSAIIVTDVQVVAGEANRLDSWHRRGDQLVVQLKEGTTGSHGITLIGRQKIRPDDATLTLHSPHLQNSQILESSMTLVDEEGLGLSFQKLGGAVPDTRVTSDGLLPPGVAVRMQIVDEADPVVLARVRPVEPIGAMAAIRSADQVAFVVHVTQWSGSLGPLQLSFDEDVRLLREPFLLIDQTPLPLLREGQRFVADQNVVRQMFDQPEFSVIWTIPADAPDERLRTMTSAVPDVFRTMKWSEILLIPLDATIGSTEQMAALKNSTGVPIPNWVQSAATSLGKEADVSQAGFLPLPPASILAGGKFALPLRSLEDETGTKASREVVAVSETLAWSSLGQSTVGETLLFLCAAKLPSKCSLHIPSETVVTEINSEEATRWEDSSRKSLMVELLRPVTAVRIRWLSRRSEEASTSVALKLNPPFPPDCVTRGFVTIFAQDGTPQFMGEATTLSLNELPAAQLPDLEACLLHARSTDSASVPASADSLPSKDTLSAALASFRNEFVSRFEASGRNVHGSITCRPEADQQQFVFLISQRARLTAIVSLITGLLVLSIAAFGRNREVFTEFPNNVGRPIIAVPGTAQPSALPSSSGVSGRTTAASAQKGSSVGSSQTADPDNFPRRYDSSQ